MTIIDYKIRDPYNWWVQHPKEFPTFLILATGFSGRLRTEILQIKHVMFKNMIAITNSREIILKPYSCFN